MLQARDQHVIKLSEKTGLQTAQSSFSDTKDEVVMVENNRISIVTSQPSESHRSNNSIATDVAKNEPKVVIGCQDCEGILNSTSGKVGKLRHIQLLRT